MFFVLCILIGIGLSTIVFIGSIHHSKAINDAILNIPINRDKKIEEPHKMAQIIKRESIVEKVLKTDE